MKRAIDDLLDAHVAYKSAIGGHTWTGAFALSTGVAGKTYLQCLTGTTSGTGTGVTSVVNELLSYKVAIKNRITEISNRIGYLNSKDVADGGKDTGSTNKSVSGTNLGFQGYVFPTGTTGRGYANTVYSHANFLGGKKINLLGKVLKAIVGVQAMYDSVTTKRSEYYEYNQAV